MDQVKVPTLETSIAELEKQHLLPSHDSGINILLLTYSLTFL